MAQQVQAKQRELQSKLEAMLSSVEDERLRPMRKQGFLAMAKCCDLSDPTAYQQCLQTRGDMPPRRFTGSADRRHDFARDAACVDAAIATCAGPASGRLAQLPEQIFFTPSSQRVPGRLQRIYIATCQDDVAPDGGVRALRRRRRYQAYPGPTADRRVKTPHHNAGGYSDQNRAQNVFNTCVGKVFDAHASMLGDVKKRIEKGPMLVNILVCCV